MSMSNTISMVVSALLMIESNSGADTRDGDGGKAVGVLQQWPVSVREANRLVGERRWRYEDRRDPDKAVAMCRTTLEWHYRRGVRDPVALACKWHRPYGPTSPGYRAKVKRVIGTSNKGNTK